MRNVERDSLREGTAVGAPLSARFRYYCRVAVGWTVALWICVAIMLTIVRDIKAGRSAGLEAGYVLFPSIAVFLFALACSVYLALVAERGNWRERGISGGMILSVVAAPAAYWAIASAM
jgi:hypothetical protein